MNAKTRRTIELGNRALNFSRAHPDASAGYGAAVARLEDRLTRAQQLADQQRDGITDVRAATKQKRDLRKKMRRTQLMHLMQVARATREVPELAPKFVIAPETTPYLAFQTVARGIVAEAQSNKEVLVKHGLVETVLESLVQALDQLDQAVDKSTEGRRAHVGARAELDAVAEEVTQIVRVMDALNRFRFADNAESMASWESATATFEGNSTAAKSTLTEKPSASGEVRSVA
ncbi:MAG: hypothetical protein H0T58_01400 [Gemmatimonadales bacterium]|nr:hypothetical protein [Gemmatimonadales bacterium]